MAFTLRIDTDNAAFEGDPSPELARILRRLADHVARGIDTRPGDGGTVLDVNGNSVARWEYVR